jgi:hypothetical protein
VERPAERRLVGAVDAAVVDVAKALPHARLVPLAGVDDDMTVAFVSRVLADQLVQTPDVMVEHGHLRH